MIQFELFGVLIDWENIGFEIGIVTLTYPVDGMFRKDNLFCFSFMQGEWYLEILSFVVIGAKA